MTHFPVAVAAVAAQVPRYLVARYLGPGTSIDMIGVGFLLVLYRITFV